MREFFDKIRPHFRGGRLTQEQVDGIERIVQECAQQQLDRQAAAYVLATAHWETGQRMVPVREGFTTTNDSAVRIITRMHQRGRIRTNYALPDPETGESYYGRGLVQITWKNNYQRMGEILGIDLVRDPDLALDPDISVQILVTGMRRGLFTGVGLDDVSEPETSVNFVNDRRVVNGRDRANEIAKIAETYYEALQTVYPQRVEPGDEGLYTAVLASLQALEKSVAGVEPGSVLAVKLVERLDVVQKTLRRVS